MAVKLSDHFTYKKLFKAVIAPILMMVFISIYSIVDGVFVSNFVGGIPFAALNLIFPLIMIIGAIGFMFGAGGSALVSMKLGEGKQEEANKIFSGIVYFTIIVAVIISAVCYFFVPKLALLLGATPEMLPYAITYGRILILGEVAFMLQNLFQTFCMVAEKPNLGFILSVIAGVTNMALDALFILVFKWGIAGAGIATITAQGVSALIAVIYLSKNNSSLLRLTKPNFKAKNIIKAMTNGSSEFLGNISASLVGIVFNIQLLKYAGESGVIAYGILMYLGFIFNAVFIGYSIGTAPIVGFNYGAKNQLELKNILKKSCFLTILTGGIMAIVGFLLSKPLSAVFVAYSADLLSFTTNAMKIFAFSFIFSGINIFTSSFFTALNNGLISAFVSILRTLVFQMLCVFVLPIFLQINGIWLSAILSEILAFIICFICIIKNKTKYGY